MAAVGVADVTLNAGTSSFNLLALNEVPVGDKVVYQNGEGQTFQQLPNGKYKFDTVPNPGAYELATKSGNVASWTPAEGTIYARLVVGA